MERSIIKSPSSYIIKNANCYLASALPYIYLVSKGM